MGLSKAIVAIKGNHLEKINEISETLNYLGDEDLANEIYQTTEFKNNWTIISDEEMIFVTEEDLLQQLSEDLNTEVVSLIIQSTSATYGFSYFKNGDARIFLIQEGNIIEKSGDELIVEQNLNLQENASENEILKIAAKLGIIFLNP